MLLVSNKIKTNAQAKLDCRRDKINAKLCTNRNYH